LRRSMRH